SVDVFDAATGNLIWSSPEHSGSIGSVKVADIDGDHIREIVWAPANATFISAFRVRRLGPSGQIWTRTIGDYISDPYTPSSLAVGDITGDGIPDVVVAGGRGRISLMVFDGHNGGLMARTDATLPTGRTPESGGYGQSLVLADIDGDGTKDLVVIGAYPQNASFMFQGVITATWAKWDTPRVLDTYPYGMAFIDGSVADYDRDGRADILVSRYDDARHTHVLMLLDARTLSVKAEIEGYQIASVIDLDTPTPTILGFLGGSVEIPVGGRDLGAIRFQNGAFQTLPWTRKQVVLPRSGRLVPARAEIDNPGYRALAVDVNGDGASEIVLDQLFLNNDEEETGARFLQAVNATTGEVVRSQPVVFVASQIGAAQIGTGANTRFASVYDTGEIYVGDSRFVLSRIQVGGFFRAQTYDGHATELPIVADLNGDGTNEIYVPKSNAVLARIDVTQGVPTSTDIMRTNGAPRLLAINTPQERSLVVGGTHLKYQLRKIDWRGKRLWNIVKPADMVGQVDLNVGRFGPFGALGVVTAGGTSYSLPVYAYDVTSARLHWRQNEGTFWDGTFAVADFDGDGIDDIATTYTIEKGRVISGLDGGTISQPSGIPKFNNLVYVDYNGSPIIFDA
ncbi:MAG TPA: VCBS repeat-containing protein, partial [Thermoanaerobaculia bacterium]|nr:VCBS repeat-containing protein [Thermoanaerobaculia bacterium]